MAVVADAVYGFCSAYLVFSARNSQAFTCDISLPAGCVSVSVGFCRMGVRVTGLGNGVPKGQTCFFAGKIFDGGGFCRGEHWSYLDGNDQSGTKEGASARANRT